MKLMSRNDIVLSLISAVNTLVKGEHGGIRLQIERSWVQSPLAAPCCLFKQDTLTPLSTCYAPVICIPGSPGAGDIVGLKCLALTSDVSRQCRGFAGVMISHQYTITLIQIRF